MSAGIVIVGGGLAAAKTVTGYREAGGTDALRLLTADTSFPYHRPPLSKRYLRGRDRRLRHARRAARLLRAARLPLRSRDDRRRRPRRRGRAVVRRPRAVRPARDRERRVTSPARRSRRRPRRRLHAAHARQLHVDPRARRRVASCVRRRLELHRAGDGGVAHAARGRSDPVRPRRPALPRARDACVLRLPT